MKINQISDILSPLLSNFPLLYVLIACILLFGISIYCLIDIEKFRLKQMTLQKQRHILLSQKQTDTSVEQLAIIDKQIKPTRHMWITRYILLLIIVCTGIIGFTSIQLFLTAYTHGYREYTKYTIDEIIHSVKNTPEEDTLPENLENITVIYYRFGCDDCNKLYPELTQYFDTLPDVYWVATRSEQGIKLRETFPVENVPIAMFITDETTAVKFPLYTKYAVNESLVISPDTDSIQELLQFRAQHVKEKE